MSEDVSQASPGPGADASPEPEATKPLTLDEVEAISKADAEPEPEVQESEAESPPADEDNVEEKTPVDSVKTRIDTLTKNWRETQRESQAKDVRIAELEQELSSRPVEAAESAKTLADFNYDEAAYQGYVMDRARSLAREEARSAVTEMQSQAAQERAAAEYAEREAAFAENHADFHALVYDKGLHISAAMVESIHTLDDGPELAYHLAQNPDIAAKIAKEPAAKAAVSMADLSRNLQDEKAKKAKKVSDAPPPPSRKVSGSEPGRRVSTTSPDSDKLSDAEWFKLEEAREMKARG